MAGGGSSFTRKLRTRCPLRDPAHTLFLGEVFNSRHDRPANAEWVANRSVAITRDEVIRRFANCCTRLFCARNNAIHVCTVEADGIAVAVSIGCRHEVVIGVRFSKLESAVPEVEFCIDDGPLNVRDTYYAGSEHGSIELDSACRSGDSQERGQTGRAVGYPSGGVVTRYP